MDSVEQSEKTFNERIDAIKLKRPDLDFAEQSPQSKGGNEEINKLREQIHYLHGVIKAEKEERLSMFSNLDNKKSQSPNYDSVIEEVNQKIENIEEKHTLDIQTLMKTIEERLKVKVKLEDSPKSPKKSSTLLLPPFGTNREDKNSEKKEDTPKDSNKKEEKAKEIKLIHAEPVVIKEITRVTNAGTKDLSDKLEMLEHSLRVGLNTISSKADLDKVDSIQQTANAIKSENSKMQTILKQMEDFKKSTEQTLQYLTAESIEVKDINTNNDKRIKKVEEISTSHEFKIKELYDLTNKKADIFDFKMLKDVIGTSNCTINRLCEILENVNYEEQAMDEQNSKGVNLKILYFKLRDKLQIIEKEQERLSKQAKESEEDSKEHKQVTAAHDHPDPRTTRLESGVNELKAELDELKSTSIKHRETHLGDLKKLNESLGTEMLKLHEDLVQQLQEKMKFVINNDVLEKYKCSLDANLSEIDKKLEKLEMNKQTYYLRKKIQALEDKITSNKPKEPGDEIPMMMCNYKCFFCARDVNMSPDKIMTVNKRMNKRYSFKSFNPPSSNLYGPGFSRVLEALRTHPELEGEIFNHTAYNPMTSPINLAPADDNGKALKSSISKKTLKLSPLSASKN